MKERNLMDFPAKGYKELREDCCDLNQYIKRLEDE